MHSYTNPAFHPAFISRIPKPAPLPHQPLRHRSQVLRQSQQPLEELPSTSQMHPAPQQHALPAVFEHTESLSNGNDPPAQQEFRQGHSRDQHAAGAEADTQFTSPDRQQRGSASHLFQQPGHAAVSVVSEDCATPRQPAGYARGASQPGVTAQHDMHAEHADLSESQNSGVEQRAPEGSTEVDPSFGDLCRRLAAVIEVQYIIL